MLGILLIIKGLEGELWCGFFRGKKRGISTIMVIGRKVSLMERDITLLRKENILESSRWVHEMVEGLRLEERVFTKARL